MKRRNLTLSELAWLEPRPEALAGLDLELIARQEEEMAEDERRRADKALEAKLKRQGGKGKGAAAQADNTTSTDDADPPSSPQERPDVGEE